MFDVSNIFENVHSENISGRYQIRGFDVHSRTLRSRDIQ